MKITARLYENIIREHLGMYRQMVFLSGPRQVGKTTLVQHVTASRKTVFLNFDIPFDLARFKAAAVLPPVEGLKTLGSPDCLVLDEAQREPEAARIVKGWYDAHLPVKIVLLSDIFRIESTQLLYPGFL